MIVGEVSYLRLERQADNLLFALVSRRYARGAIIITSNRGFEQWGDILGDAMVAAALILTDGYMKRGLECPVRILSPGG